MHESPIVFIDEDEDDQLMFQQALSELAVPHRALFFTDGQAALHYLSTTTDVPFLIISEISMPRMDGLELRQQIEQDPGLRKKSIPFIFMTYPMVEHLVEEAYELTIQGLFEKKTRYEDWKQQLQDILRYWTECQHPKRFPK